RMIYDVWTECRSSNLYKQYFMTREEEWWTRFEELKKYLKSKGKRPPKSSQNKKIKSLARWTGRQLSCYAKKSDLMKIEAVYNAWKLLVTSKEYNKCFMTKKEMWFRILQEVKDYVDENEKLPPRK